MRLPIAFSIGAVLGADAAIVFAPKINERIRRPLVDRVNRGIERGQAKVHKIAGQIIRAAEQAPEKVHHIEDAVDAGVRALRRNSTGPSSLLNRAA